MTSFSITHTKPDGTTDTYTGNNISNITVNFSSPLAPMPLPQQADTDTVLIKIEGNTTTVNIAWTVTEETSSPFTDVNVTTPIDIINHFKTSFVPVTVEDKYTLTIGTMVFEGTFTRTSFSVSGTSPVVWNGIIEFVHGNVATSYDEDLPDSPNIGQITAASSIGKIDILNISLDYTGSEPTITDYLIQVKAVDGGGTVWTDITSQYSPDTNTSQHSWLDIDVGGSGTYEVRVAAKNSNGVGEFTKPVTVNIL